MRIINECINDCEQKFIEFDIENNSSDSIVLLNKFFKETTFNNKILFPNTSDRTNIILFTIEEMRYMEFSGEYLPDYSKESHLIIIPSFSKVKFYSTIKMDSSESKINNWNLKYFFKYAKLNNIYYLMNKNNFIIRKSFFIILENNDMHKINIIDYNSIPNPDNCKNNYDINFLKSAFNNIIQLCQE